MDRSCTLLALPEDIARDILSKWIGFRNIARLDSAFCNTKTRATFFSLAYSEHALYSSICVDLHRPMDVKSALHWGMKRGAVFDAIRVTELFVTDHDFRTTLLRNSGGAVRTLDASHHYARIKNTTVLMDFARMCQNVEVIRLGHIPLMAFESGLPEMTRSCHNLTTLEVGSMCNDAPTLGAALKKCRSLTHLELSGHNMTVPVEVALPTLTHLDIAECLVPDETAVAIGQHCARLKTLRIFSPIYRQDIQDSGARALLDGCPLVDWSTELRCAEGISTDLRVEMARRCNFTKLEFRANRWRDLSTSLVQGVLRSSPGLTELIGSDIDRLAYPLQPCYLDDAAAAVAAQYCPLLRVLHCLSAPIGDAGLEALARHCKALEDVTLVQCTQVTVQGVRSLLQHCTTLKKLHVGYNAYQALPSDLHNQVQERGIELIGAKIGWFC